MPTLPIELIEFVIDNLSDDLGTLHTCSLVARGWHAFSRVYIFRKVDLKSMHQIKRLVQALDADNALERFVDTVVVWIVPDPVGRCAQWPSVLTVLDALPILLLRRLPNLAHLDLHHYGVKEHRPLIHSFLLRPSLIRSLRRCAPIRKLSLYSVTFKTSSDLVNLIREGLPTLERLRCISIDVHQFTEPRSPAQQRRLSLQYLSLHHVDANVARILILMSPSTLRSLSMGMELTLDNWKEETGTTRYAYFRHLHQIQEVVIYLRADVQPEEESRPTLSDYFAILANMLHHVPSRELQVLTLSLPLSSSYHEEPAFEFQSYHDENHVGRNWEFPSDPVTHRDMKPFLREQLPYKTVRRAIHTVEHLISQFSMLEAMWFDISSTDTRIWDGLVAKMFPNLHKKGMVRVVRESISSEIELTSP
ncbi:hypothetical protein C8Q76DRAFT_139810 [Earliella scabrosa]|nr:hypothetical protein C8Q76DRAFT_139810 [Earliella scabrosa]